MLPALEKGNLLAKMDEPDQAVKSEPQYQQQQQFANGQYAMGHSDYAGKSLGLAAHPARFQYQAPQMSEQFYTNGLAGYKLPASPSSTSSSSSSSCSSYSANFNYSLPFYSPSVNGYSSQNLTAAPFMPANLLNHSKSQSFDSTSSNEEGQLVIF